MTTKSTRSKRKRIEREDAPEADRPATPTPAAERPAPALECASRRRTARAVDACAAACVSTEARGVIHAVARAVRSRAATLNAAVGACLDEAESTGPDRWHAAEAAARGLARLARGRGGDAPDGRHLERLVTLARGACDALRERDTRSARFVTVLARLFADVEACRDLEPAAAAAIREELARLVTAGGTVGLSGSAAVVERVGRWTGVRAAVAELGGTGWDDDAEQRWTVAATNALRLIGGRGRRIGERGAREPFVDALAQGTRGPVRRTARLLRRGRGRVTRPLAPDLHDPAAATTIIRSGWERGAVRVFIDYRGAAPRLEIAAGDRLLVDGSWDWGVEADGRPLEAEGPWAVAGWEAGRKAAFLEITAPLAGGMRLERHVAMLRRQRIVLLADAIKPAAAGATPGADAITCRAAVTLAPGLDAEPAAETREVLVYDGDMRLLALPLALPEWRNVGRGGLAVTDGRLALEQCGHRRVYAPLWLDCDPRRIGRPLTWRQLTVADTRRILPPHQAAGFRVQTGSDQWLLYRTLDATRNRSLLGCNVSSEFLLGRVKRSGEVARTIEIE